MSFLLQPPSHPTSGQGRLRNPRWGEGLAAVKRRRSVGGSKGREVHGQGPRGGRWSTKGGSLRIRGPLHSGLRSPPAKPSLKTSILGAHPSLSPPPQLRLSPLGSGHGVTAPPRRIRRQLNAGGAPVRLGREEFPKLCWSEGVEDRKN